MSFTEYSSKSPYSETPQTNWYLDILEFRNIPKFSNDQTITLQSKYEKRPDLLANDLYGSTRYWWVFAVRNPNIIKDSIYDLKEGMELEVTQPEQLFGVLNG